MKIHRWSSWQRNAVVLEASAHVPEGVGSRDSRGSSHLLYFSASRAVEQLVVRRDAVLDRSTAAARRNPRCRQARSGGCSDDDD